MARINKPVVNRLKTAGGAKAAIINPELQLRRSVMACLLWENSFYEEGESIADRIKKLVHANKPEIVAQIAYEARTKMKMRHVPLLLMRELARHKDLKASKLGYSTMLALVIQRADELTEFLAIYWKDKKEKLSSQVKKGLAKAFVKFSEYDLAKYNRADAIKLRDVLFLCHAKPKDKAQEIVFKRLVDNQLAIPDTWEVELSASKDKKASWERLLSENKLGALALIRNLRNMKEAKVSEKLINSALESMKTERVLPFRFVTAAAHAPHLEDGLERAMFRSLSQQEKLPGKTVLIIDVSGSMTSAGTVSKHSDLSRLDAACALAAMAREVCEESAIYATAGSDGRMIHATKRVPARRGFSLVDAIRKDMYSELGGGGIFLKQCLDYVHKEHDSADRIIVFTDEQDCDKKCNPATENAFGKKNYLINISVEKNGIGYGKWIHIDGFSEAVLQYINEYEKSESVV